MGQNEDNIARDNLRQKLQAAGVENIKCGYEGGGDSGGITYTCIFNAAGVEVSIEKIDRFLIGTLAETVDDLLNRKLGSYGDGDGGFGNVYWNLTTDDVKIEHNEVSTNYDERNGW